MKRWCSRRRARGPANWWVQFAASVALGAAPARAFAEDARAKDALAKDAPMKDALAKDAPMKDAPVRDAPAVEVVIAGERHAEDGSYVTRREARELPGAFGDPLRSVEAMPGVSGVVSGLPYFYVRGAPPGNVGYLLDGIRLPMLYHLFAGPSVLHPAFIESVELHRGGFSASLGRYAGAVVEARTSDARPEWHAEGSLRLYDAGVMASAPFAEGRGRVRLGGRYSFTGLLISALSPVTLEYWDYQGLVEYDLGARDHLRLMAFGAYDHSSQPEQYTEAGVQFHRVDLRYRHEFGAHSEFDVAVTLGSDRSRQEDNSYSYFSRTSITEYGSTRGEGISLRDQLFATRATLHHRLSSRALWHAGVDFNVDGIHLEQRSADAFFFNGQLSKNFASRSDYVVGSFAELDWTLGRGVRLLPGLRADGYFSEGRSAFALEPRLVAAFDVSSRLTLRHSLGLSHQPPSAAPPGLPGAQQTANLSGGLQRALQASSSAELHLPSDFVGSVTLFDSVYDRLSDPVGTSGSFALSSSDTRSLGSAYGVELSLRRPLTRRLGGFVNYTLSRTTRSHDVVSSLAAFDRTHVANLVLSYDLGARYRAGLRFFYESGVPVRHTTVDGPSYDGSERAPGFFRLDLRLEKRWTIFQTGYLAAVAELLNATFSKEVLRRNCNESGCNDSVFGPLFLPSVGVEVAY